MFKSGKLLNDLAALVNHVINTHCLQTASEFILFLCPKEHKCLVNLR